CIFFNYLFNRETYSVKRTKLETNPYSLSYQATVLTNCPPFASNTSVNVASKTDPCVSPTTSEETISSSVYPYESFAAAFITSLILSTVTSLPNAENSSTKPAVMTGTRVVVPVMISLTSGMTFPNALAAPVVTGITF